MQFTKANGNKFKKKVKNLTKARKARVQLRKGESR